MAERVKEFHGTARISFKQAGTKQGDVFYTFEFGETVENDEGFTIDESYDIAKAKMWDRVDEEIKKKVYEVLGKKEEQ